LEKIVQGNSFGNFVQFNICADNNSKIVTLKKTDFIVIPKVAYYGIIGIKYVFLNIN
jgi:hypothetical protein